MRQGHILAKSTDIGTITWVEPIHRVVEMITSFTECLNNHGRYDIEALARALVVLYEIDDRKDAVAFHTFGMPHLLNVRNVGVIRLTGFLSPQW